MSIQLAYLSLFKNDFFFLKYKTASQASIARELLKSSSDPADWYQDARHFEFNLGDNIEYKFCSLSWLKYSPGYLAVIHPITNADEVKNFLSLKWAGGNSADDLLEIQLVYKGGRIFFQYLRQSTSDETEKERLAEFLSLDHAARRTIQEVASEFRNVHIPKDYIFDVFPPVRPHKFALSQRLRIKVVKGFIQLPANDVPVICIGPGTGVAPMRSVIEERIKAKAHGT
ncbi:hypothetical protein F5878DRAFT_637300 [Lentinula raphanica]|uniref:FAD-binding FR-type domain-containing protein n=1 Tax=Lentinula raphanica TaxID=153919 RepID=A0AA38UJW2_9AGAR|nr:hypothetical protein F5878DRAFT_637300 [Lentinula raphanica]